MKVRDLIKACKSEEFCGSCSCYKECNVFMEIYGIEPEYAQVLVDNKEQRRVLKPVTVTFDEKWLESEVEE